MSDTKAGPQLDMLVAEHVFGWKRGRKFANGNGEWIIDGNVDFRTWGTTPTWSSDIQKAWPVVEQLCKSGVEVQIHIDLLGTHVVVIDGEAVLADVTEKDAPYAICLAALRVKGVEL